MENWLDKYKPNKLSEVLGDKQQIKQIDQFIKKFSRKNTENLVPNLIIIGTNGIGKTLIIDLVIQENGLEKITADLSGISVVRKNKRKKKMDKEISGSNRSVNTYYQMLDNYKKLLPTGEYVCKKIALVFDDVSNISNPKEKEAIKAIIKLNSKRKKFPIIIIANNKHSKIVNELKKLIASGNKKNKGAKTSKIDNKTTSGTTKKSTKIDTKFGAEVNQIFLRPPSYSDVLKFIKDICDKENLNLSSSYNDDGDIYMEIIQHSQNDIRRLVNILEELKQLYKNDKITFDDFMQFKETSKTKDTDPGIFEATRILLDNYNGLENTLVLYGDDRATIPLMIHENYPYNIAEQYPRMSVNDQIDTIYQISQSISESDKVDGLIYSNQCWNLQPVHGFYSCVLPSYYANLQPGKLCKNLQYKYTQDYNKTSIKKINNKVIKKAQDNQRLKKASIYDFLYIASILKDLLAQNQFELIAKLMKPYRLSLKEIESIIKIDKIQKSKEKIPGKQKTILKDLLEKVV